MRTDMAQVIIERPRLGGGFKYPRNSMRRSDKQDLETAIPREGIKYAWNRYAGHTKNLNENLAPLRRFLRSRVGQHWDGVYSEICERISRKSAIQMHIVQHLFQYVCTNPYEIAGDIGRSGFGWRRYQFYVDPKNGVLREKTGPRRRTFSIGPSHDNRLRDIVAIDESRCLKQIDGIWYELTVENAPACGSVFDLLSHRRLHSDQPATFWRYWRRDVYIARKRQLNSKEIRRMTAQTR